jgi:hypothetical protein
LLSFKGKWSIKKFLLQVVFNYVYKLCERCRTRSALRASHGLRGFGRKLARKFWKKQALGKKVEEDCGEKTGKILVGFVDFGGFGSKI